MGFLTGKARPDSAPLALGAEPPYPSMGGAI